MLKQFFDSEKLLKALADATRLKILAALLEKPKFVSELALELNISESTVSFHLKKLQTVGFVASKKEQYYQTYYIVPDKLDFSLVEIISSEKSATTGMFENSVSERIFKNGTIKNLPVQIKLREVALKTIASAFKVKKGYSEREVNLIIADYCDDFVSCRKELLKSNYLYIDNELYFQKVIKNPKKTE